MSLIWKILLASDWEAAQAAGVYQGSDLDRADGYIHLSTPAQAAETARRHFAGQENLVVLEIETEDLAPDLRWEPSRGGDLFPHLYGHLDPVRVRRVFEAPLDDQGVPQVEGR